MNSSAKLWMPPSRPPPGSASSDLQPSRPPPRPGLFPARSRRLRASPASCSRHKTGNRDRCRPAGGRDGRPVPPDPPDATARQRRGGCRRSRSDPPDGAANRGDGPRMQFSSSVSRRPGHSWRSRSAIAARRPPALEAGRLADVLLWARPIGTVVWACWLPMVSCAAMAAAWPCNSPRCRLPRPRPHPCLSLRIRAPERVFALAARRRSRAGPTPGIAFQRGMTHGEPPRKPREPASRRAAPAGRTLQLRRRPPPRH